MGRSNPSGQKRQRELKRKEKAEDKRVARQARKIAQTEGPRPEEEFGPALNAPETLASVPSGVGEL